MNDQAPDCRHLQPGLRSLGFLRSLRSYCVLRYHVIGATDHLAANGKEYPILAAIAAELVAVIGLSAFVCHLDSTGGNTDRPHRAS